MKLELRQYLYAALVAFGPVVVFYGLATGEEVAMWIGVVATLLNVSGGGAALKNFNHKVEVVEVSDVEVSEGRHAEDEMQVQ